MDKETCVPRSCGRSFVVLYNEVRPHGAIGHKVPISLLNHKWRRQPAIVKRPGNSTFRRSKEWYRSTR